MQINRNLSFFIKDSNLFSLVFLSSLYLICLSLLIILINYFISCFISSGKIEENWFISTEDFIKFNKDEYFIPMFSGNTFKLVPLSKLCQLNENMKYNDIIDYFTNF